MFMTVFNHCTALHISIEKGGPTSVFLILWKEISKFDKNNDHFFLTLITNPRVHKSCTYICVSYVDPH